MSSRRPRAAAVAVIAALLLAYAGVAWVSVAGESPTFDEPYHAVSAWVQWNRHDFRLDNEDPPLWQYWASLPNGPAALSADFGDGRWRTMGSAVGGQWGWAVDTLYRTPGNDAARFIGRCRAMMLVVAVALGVAIAAWAWRLAGPVAAVVATGLFAVDPNLIAHGPLMKNDVAASLAWLGVAYALWDVGRRVTVGSAVRLAVLATVPLTVKFSGLLVVALVPAVLLVRVLLPDPWPVLTRSADTRRRRLATAAGLGLLTAAVAVVGVWAVYGFRFRSGPDATDRLDFDQLAARSVDHERQLHPARATPGLTVRAAVFAHDHRLLPEAFLTGFLFTYAESQLRPSYLLGEVSLTGWWYYFPFAMAVKTPVATLAAAGLLATVVVRRRWGTGARRWAAAAVAAPVVVYMASAVSTNLNIGLRHVLPVYPLVFVAIGWATAAAWRRRPRGTRAVVIGLAVALGVETAVAFPQYISFFNVPSAAKGRGGYDLLGDSNLDWGQSLPALARWQRRHGDEPLYLSYFGLADPAAFGVRFVPLPSGFGVGGPVRPRFPDLSRPCWIAFSVSNLQLAATQPEALGGYYQRFAVRPPTAVVGGSIYLFHYSPVDGRR